MNLQKEVLKYDENVSFSLLQNLLWKETPDGPPGWEAPEGTVPTCSTRLLARARSIGPMPWGLYWHRAITSSAAMSRKPRGNKRTPAGSRWEGGKRTVPFTVPPTGTWMVRGEVFASDLRRSGSDATKRAFSSSCSSKTSQAVAEPDGRTPSSACALSVTQDFPVSKYSVIKSQRLPLRERSGRSGRFPALRSGQSSGRHRLRQHRVIQGLPFAFKIKATFPGWPWSLRVQPCRCTRLPHVAPTCLERRPPPSLCLEASKPPSGC